jgi:hypothetical protein
MRPIFHGHKISLPKGATTKEAIDGLARMMATYKSGDLVLEEVWHNRSGGVDPPIAREADRRDQKTNTPRSTTSTLVHGNIKGVMNFALTLNSATCCLARASATSATNARRGAQGWWRPLARGQRRPRCQPLSRLPPTVSSPPVSRRDTQQKHIKSRSSLRLLHPAAQRVLYHLPDRTSVELPKGARCGALCMHCSK